MSLLRKTLEKLSVFLDKTLPCLEYFGARLRFADGRRRAALRSLSWVRGHRGHIATIGPSMPARHRSYSSCRILNSTRRFFARPSAVLLSAMGCSRP